MTIDAPIDMRAAAAPADDLLTAPILPTLLRLVIPNTIAMFGGRGGVASMPMVGMAMGAGLVARARRGPGSPPPRPASRWAWSA